MERKIILNEELDKRLWELKGKVLDDVIAGVQEIMGTPDGVDLEACGLVCVWCMTSVGQFFLLAHANAEQKERLEEDVVEIGERFYRGLSKTFFQQVAEEAERLNKPNERGN